MSLKLELSFNRAASLCITMNQLASHARCSVPWRAPSRRRQPSMTATTLSSNSTPPAAASSSERASRRAALAALVAGIAAFNSGKAEANQNAPREGQVRQTDEEWRQLLSPDAYAVLRRAKTERRFSSPLVDEKRTGTFVCGGCGAPLFPSEAKYESGTGWPSFFDALPSAVALEPDNSIPFMPRIEVRCQRCLGHLGHVFDDGPQPTGLRYCMNGAALGFEPKEA